MSMSGKPSSILGNTPIYDPAKRGTPAQQMWASKLAANAAKTPKPSERELENRDGWSFWQDDGLGYMTVLVDQQSRWAWMSLDTYETISGNIDADLQLEDDLESWGSGMKYLVTESGKYGEAARAAMPDKPMAEAVDPLVQLERDATALLVQCAQLNREPSELQMRAFAERLADVRTRLAALGDHLQRVEELVNLAAVAVADSMD